MKAAVITDSTNYMPRAVFAAEHYARKGYDVTLIVPDFDHAAKKKIARKSGSGEGITRVYIDTIPYTGNISLKRLLYHYDFAKKARSETKALKPDLLYVIIPGNSLAPMAAEYVQKSKAKLIFDLIDLWPESLPIEKIKSIPPVRYWRSLRDDNINSADIILTECSLYIDELGLDRAKAKPMYWHKTAFPDPDPLGRDTVSAADGGNPSASGDTAGSAAVNLAYLGSINNIIDIPRIIRILGALNNIAPVRLNIIGDGEKKDEFLGALGESGIDYAYFGAVYDEDRKSAILAGAQWGLNIMKPSVRVGLTMKSIDYMAGGLRLINNIPGDTWRLIEKEHIGVNIGREGTDESEGSDPYAAAAAEIAGFKGPDKFKIREIFNERFTPAAAEKVLDEADCIAGI